MRNKLENCKLPRCNSKPDNWVNTNLITKPDNNPLSINILSNHSPNIIKNLPENISKRINTLSPDETTFNKSKDLYNNALAESGFKYKITFQKTGKYLHNNKITPKKEKEILYGLIHHLVSMFPQISVKNYSALLGKHFPKMHQLHKEFNRNNVKVRYSSLPNFKSVINGHNAIFRLTEKYHIIFSTKNLLNKRNELVTKCRHENKFYLANFACVT